MRDVADAALEAVRLLGGGDEAERVVLDTVEAASLQEDAELVALVVRKYVRRSAWAARIADDLTQEAQVALVKARRTFSPEKGCWGGYAYRAAWLACASFLVADSSPVTRKEKGGVNLARRVGETALEGFIADVDVEEVYADAEWTERVRERVLFLCEGDEGIYRVLTRETTPARLASERGVPVQRVYAAASAARTRVTMDPAVCALMRAKKGVEHLEGEQEWAR